MIQMKTMAQRSNIRFAFFGMPPLAAGVLGELAASGYAPDLLVDSTRFSPGFFEDLAAQKWDVFIVASFGKILSRTFLDIPERGVLNIHPSLLPRLRGPSPIRSAILRDEKETGVSIMLLDEQMDHGPIIAQKKIAVPSWPPHGRALDELLAHEGGRLLAQILPAWMEGEIEARPQNHDLATYCEKFTKEDGLLNLSGDPYKNLLKIRAFEGWPGTYAFFERGGKKIRVQILDAHLEDSSLAIDRVKPEGKNEMPYADFLRSGARPCA